MPNRITAGTPAACTARASSTSVSIEWWYCSLSDGIGVAGPLPARTNSGWIRSAAERRVSRTMPRRASVRRSLRRRVAGNDMALIVSPGLYMTITCE